MFHKRCKLDLLDRGLAGQRRRVGTITFTQCFMPRCVRLGIIVVALTYVFLLADGGLGLARAEGPMQGPLVIRGAEQSKAVTPRVSDADLRSLPRPSGWQPGDPVREVPKR